MENIFCRKFEKSGKLSKKLTKNVLFLEL